MKKIKTVILFIWSQSFLFLYLLTSTLCTKYFCNWLSTLKWRPTSMATSEPIIIHITFFFNLTVMKCGKNTCNRVMIQLRRPLGITFRNLCLCQTCAVSSQIESNYILRQALSIWKNIHFFVIQLSLSKTAKKASLVQEEKSVFRRQQSI